MLILVTTVYVVCAALLVALALKAKNLSLPRAQRSWEDAEQMRSVRGGGTGSELDPLTTLH